MEQKIRIGIRGSFAIFISYQMKTPKAATPMIKGASAEEDVQELVSLAPVWRPNRKATVPPMIISTPVQSRVRRLSSSKASGMSGVRVNVKIMRANALMGRLIQTGLVSKRKLSARIPPQERLTAPPPPNRLRENTTQHWPKTARRGEHQTHKAIVFRPIAHGKHFANENRNQHLNTSTPQSLNRATSDEHRRRM